MGRPKPDLITAQVDTLRLAEIAVSLAQDVTHLMHGGNEVYCDSIRRSLADARAVLDAIEAGGATSPAWSRPSRLNRERA